MSGIVAIASGALDLYTSSPWLYYGAVVTWLPLLIACVVGVGLEWVAATEWCRPYLITYGKGTSRPAAVAQSRSQIPFSAQVKGTLTTFFGPLSLVGLVGLRYLLEWRTNGRTVWPLPSLGEFLVDFALSALIADFGLYWGHRLQHDVVWLWDRCHWEHHQIKNPSAFSVAFIDRNDAALQSAIPLAITAAIVGPHPVTILAYHTFHFTTNFVNHSGIDHWALNLLTLKFIPGRSSNAHHDFHHHFSTRGSGSKNFAEIFDFWDRIFGTYCDTRAVTSHDKPKSKAA